MLVTRYTSSTSVGVMLPDKSRFGQFGDIGVRMTPGERGKDTLPFVTIWHYSKRIWPRCIEFPQNECTLSDNTGEELIMFRED